LGPFDENWLATKLDQTTRLMSSNVRAACSGLWAGWRCSELRGDVEQS
jgi:hypothetical protein